LRLNGERNAVPVENARESIEFFATFSPDGRWIAYASNESGRFEVDVRSYPERAGKWQASTTGGNYPRWSRDGSESSTLPKTARS